MFKRHITREVSIGNVKIGGNNPIAIQSMTNTDTLDVKATVTQIKALTDAGCQIVRVTVPKPAAVEAFAEIKKQSPIPVVADIHFDYRLAIGAIEAGADKIRINPGNIEGEDKLKQIIAKAKEKNIPIRIGVNGGSTEKILLIWLSSIVRFSRVRNLKTLLFLSNRLRCRKHWMHTNASLRKEITRCISVLPKRERNITDLSNPRPVSGRC